MKFLISTFLQDSILKFGIYVVLCHSKICKTIFENLQYNIRKSAIHSLSAVRRDRMSGLKVYTDDLVFEGIKEKSRAKYKKAWNQFQDYHGEAREEFETRMPTEEEFLSYFKHL